jgi:NTP pyrophosphatase (non-canonical NTP hydrolase)|tara:strand:+ start:363 stop:557 length:195 start_codon:yes stop_codon:yes gene_type:complete
VAEVEQEDQDQEHVLEELADQEVVDMVESQDQNQLQEQLEQLILEVVAVVQKAALEVDKVDLEL